jgi:phage replication initiation protein
MDTPSHFDDGNSNAPATGMPAPRAAGAGAVHPPSGNTGGKNNQPTYEHTDPETGEISLICPTGLPFGVCNLIPISTDGVHPYAAITDYLNCTFKFDPEEESFADLFQELFDLLGDKFAPAVDRNRGLHGYSRSFQLGESSAQLAIGGQGGTMLLSMPGEACSLLHPIWPQVVKYLQFCRNARITRWDGAVDDYSGLHSVDWAVQQYLAGEFTTGGNKPSCNNVGNWTDPDGKGRTFYVGKRKNGKLIRIYEKGQQLGALWHPWVRWEVELHNKDRVIPWEVLLDPARYFVGCYPQMLTWVQEEMTPIRTIQKQTQISYDHLTSYAAIAYGPLFNVMLEVEGSPEAVFKKLHRGGTPRRLQHPFVDKPSNFLERNE